MIPEDVFQRLLGGNSLNTQSRRLMDWTFGFQAFLQKPWFGNGMQAAKKLVLATTGMDWYTIHNTYIVYLAQMGIMGAILFFSVLFKPAVKLWKKHDRKFMWMVYCGLLFAALMIESCYTYVLIVPLSIFYAIINFEERYCLRDGISILFDLKNI